MTKLLTEEAINELLAQIVAAFNTAGLTSDESVGYAYLALEHASPELAKVYRMLSRDINMLRKRRPQTLIESYLARVPADLTHAVVAAFNEPEFVERLRAEAGRCQKDPNRRTLYHWPSMPL